LNAANSKLSDAISSPDTIAIFPFHYAHRVCVPFDDISQHKYRSIFVTYWMPRKTERCLCRLVSLNGKHPMCT